MLQGGSIQLDMNRKQEGLDKSRLQNLQPSACIKQIMLQELEKNSVMIRDFSSVAI
jgi:hypothetical protein